MLRKILSWATFIGLIGMVFIDMVYSLVCDHVKHNIEGFRKKKVSVTPDNNNEGFRKKKVSVTPDNIMKFPERKWRE